MHHFQLLILHENKMVVNISLSFCVKKKETEKKRKKDHAANDNSTSRVVIAHCFYINN